MVEAILQWLKNISIFLIFMTTVVNLIPEKEDKKPVRFFLGIVMVLIFFQPVLKAGGLEQKMAQTLDRLTLEEEAAAMKNVQIPQELFMKLLRYHLLDDDSCTEEVKNGLEQKMNAMVERELYTRSKTAPTEEEREKARQEYLDRRGIPEDSRW